MSDQMPPGPVRKIRCPRCGGPSVFAGENGWRPFCSERCAQIDLGAWASEAYRVPGQTTEEHAAAGPKH